MNGLAWEFFRLQRKLFDVPGLRPAQECMLRTGWEVAGTCRTAGIHRSHDGLGWKTRGMCNAVPGAEVRRWRDSKLSCSRVFLNALRVESRV